MGVNFGGCDRFMAKHILDGSKISAPFHKMCGKGMSKGMRAYSFIYLGLFGQCFNNGKNHDSRQFSSSSI